jgi:hypothetical protein
MIAIAFLFVRLLYDCFKSPALPPKAEVHPRSRYVAKVPIVLQKYFARLSA